MHDTEVNLSWTDTIDADPGEDGYRIEKSENGGASFTLVADVAPNATGYTVIDLKASTAYTFRISAFKGSTFSDAITATATTPAPPRGRGPGNGHGERHESRSGLLRERAGPARRSR